MLAEFFQKRENDLQKAVQLYRVNCDEYGYAKSCLEYGTVAFTGVKEKNVKSDPVEALKYFEKGCSLGSSDNCLNSGMLLVSPLLEKTALERDLPKVSKRSNNSLESCMEFYESAIIIKFIEFLIDRV